MKVKQAYEIQEALEIAECKETDEHERMINVKWVNLKEIRKVVAAFDFGDLELNREQCNAFRAFFNELCDIEFRPYLRCVRPSEACTSGCGFLEKCQKLNPKLDLASYDNNLTSEVTAPSVGDGGNSQEMSDPAYKTLAPRPQNSLSNDKATEKAEP